MLFHLKVTGVERHSLWVRLLSSPLAGFHVIPVESIVTKQHEDILNTPVTSQMTLYTHAQSWESLGLYYQHLPGCSPAISDSSLFHTVINRNS